MKRITFWLLLLFLPFIERFVCNRYLGAYVDVNLLFVLVVYAAMRRERHSLFLAYGIGLAADLFRSDIIGIHAILFTIASMVVVFFRNMVNLGSRLAESLILAAAFLVLYVLVYLSLFIYPFFAGSGGVKHAALSIVFNAVLGMCLFWLLDRLLEPDDAGF